MIDELREGESKGEIELERRSNERIKKRELTIYSNKQNQIIIIIKIREIIVANNKQKKRGRVQLVYYTYYSIVLASEWGKKSELTS